MNASDIIVIVIAALLIVAIIILTVRERRKVIKWLIWAVSAAEKEIGKKTGQLKLFTVYSWFCERFPKFATVVPFSVFSKWVDLALKTMNQWIDSGSPIGKYITGKEKKDEADKEKLP